MIRSRSALLAPFVVAALLLLSFFGVQGVHAAFTAGVSNNANTVGTGTQFLTAKNGTTAATDCSSTPSGTSIPATTNFACGGTTWPTATSAQNTNFTNNETLTNTGTTSFTSATLKASSCYPAQFVDSANAAYALVARGTLGFGAAGPTTISGSGSVNFDGSTAVGTGVGTAAAGPQTFTVAGWFKTSAKQGTVVGWSNATSVSDYSQWDRMLYLDQNGYLTWGTYQGGTQTIATTKSYADGAWHFAVGTAKANVTAATSQIALYVDGAQVGTTKIIANANPAEGSTGWWRIGSDNSGNGWTSSASNFFNGNISNVGVWPSVLTATQIGALYSATTQTAEAATAITTDGASYFWPLTDTGTTAFTGALAGGAADPCTHIQAEISSTGGCVYPATTTCPTAYTTTYTFATLVAAGTLTLTPSTLTQAQTLTFATTRNSNYNGTYDVGLHLLVPIVITEKPFTQVYTWAGNYTII